MGCYHSDIIDTGLFKASASRFTWAAMLSGRLVITILYHCVTFHGWCYVSRVLQVVPVSCI